MGESLFFTFHIGVKMSDLQRITSDIARCKERIAQMEAGTRGQIPAGCRHQDGARAFDNQLRAQRQSLERLEGEYVNAMLAEHRWNPAAVIERMQAPAAPQSQPMQAMTIKVGDLTRVKLQTLLEDTTGNFIPRSKLEVMLRS